jgi:uncharacterized protein (TIGR02597 family)
MTTRALYLSLALAATFGMAFTAQAQTVATDPVGFTTTQCLANSDTYVGVPFTRPPEFVGAVQSVAGNTITLGGTPFTQGQFVYSPGVQPKTYFVLIALHPNAGSNPKEGHFYTVTSNGTNSLTIDTEGEDISGIQPQTQIVIAPYPTISSVFPASDANVSFIPSPNSISRQTQLLIPNYGGQGFNLSSAATYYYLNGAWRKVGSPTTEDKGDDPLVNAGYFIVRNAGTATTLTTLGSVLMKSATVPLISRTTGPQDNFVSVIRPIDVKLNDLGLISSGVFASSPNALSRTDQLFVFNNTQPGINKSASSTYYYSNSAWRKVGASAADDFGNDVIPTGAGFIIRKAASDGVTKYWKNSPTY